MMSLLQEAQHTHKEEEEKVYLLQDLDSDYDK